jgi:choice-of-anchor B domain-containing protein
VAQPTLTLLSQKNDYSNVGYNDCWGYTAPDGREYALLGVRNGTSVIDITDAPTLVEIGFIPSVSITWKDIKTYRHYAYTVTESIGEGLQIIDLSGLPGSVQLVKSFNSILTTSHNIYIDTTRGLLYVEGGHHANTQVRIWDLADPVNPVEVGSFGPNEDKGIHDVFAHGNRAYISEGSGGFFSIWDVTNPASPALLRRFASPDSGYAHNAWATEDGNFLLTTEEIPINLTMKMFDISDLNAIRLRGTYIGPTQDPHNVHVKGSYAYISHYRSGLRIVDISNPDQLTEAAHYDTYVGGFSDRWHGAWGAYPFFASGKVLASDIEQGLFVFHFLPAVFTGVVDKPSSSIPADFSLSQNFPNPFNPETSIQFGLAEPSHVRIVVTDLLGRTIDVLVDGDRQAGTHRITWNPNGVASGVYIYTMRAGGKLQTRRMIFQR